MEYPWRSHHRIFLTCWVEAFYSSPKSIGSRSMIDISVYSMRQSIWMNVYDTVSCATTLCEDFIFLPLFLKLSIQDFPTSILWTGIGRPHHTLLYCCADPAWLCSCIYRVFFFDEKLKSFWDLYYPNKMHILVTHYKNGVEPRSATEKKAWS